MRRTLRALPLTTTLPMETCPSPIITTLPPRRTHKIVVPCMAVSENARRPSGAATRNMLRALIIMGGVARAPRLMTA